jgi:hypothetical protein
MKIFNKKIIFLIFKNNYRYNALGNFAKNRIYNKFLFINLSGRTKSILGKIIYFFKLGNFISIDGDPFLKNQNSINIWYSGTILKIKKKYLNFKNNYVNIINSTLIRQENQFNIYPLIDNSGDFKFSNKIIFMGKIHFEPNRFSFFDDKKLFQIKDHLLNDFTLIDNNDFWSEYTKNKSQLEKFDNYKIIKTFMRKEILKKINKYFKNHLHVYSDKFSKDNFQYFKPVYNIKKVHDIYKGNLCIDTGPIPGSVTFSPRAIQIFESQGIMIQAEQKDSKSKLKNLYDDLVAKNINDYLSKIEILFTRKEKRDETIEKIQIFSNHCKFNMEQTLLKIFDK